VKIATLDLVTNAYFSGLATEELGVFYDDENDPTSSCSLRSTS
jgi:hypothetical protein